MPNPNSPEVLNKRVPARAKTEAASISPSPQPAGGDGARAFDFLAGSWRVEHRRLKERLAGSSDWDRFSGTSIGWLIMGGPANIDDNVLDHPSGSYRAITLRLYDAETDLWSIRWVDGRTMRVEPPVVGRFQDGIGSFLGDDELNGRPIKVRFLWSDITDRSARWEQAFSADDGLSWETNWVMSFERSA